MLFSERKISKKVFGFWDLLMRTIRKEFFLFSFRKNNFF